MAQKSQKEEGVDDAKSALSLDEKNVESEVRNTVNCDHHDNGKLPRTKNIYVLICTIITFFLIA